MTPWSSLTRHLPLPGTHNFRDVGGYAVAGGGAVRWRTLFRSDSLHRLNEATQRDIVSLGVRTVVDLRH
ncbi:MAG: tyrosine-protein phosphatase, partial [Dehalococcoidia bacterium]